MYGATCRSAKRLLVGQLRRSASYRLNKPVDFCARRRPLYPTAQVRCISSTNLKNDKNGAEQAVADDDPVPDWQNPLHHNNPDMQKIFREDFDSEEDFEEAVQPLPPFETDPEHILAPPHIEDLANRVVSMPPYCVFGFHGCFSNFAFRIR